MLVGVIDYGLGNLRSVAGAVEYLDHDVVISSNKTELEQADRLILPGVGAFGDGIKALKNLGLDDFLTEQVVIKKKKILGICLGFQLMAKSSSEFGQHEGLAWLDAEVERLPSHDLRIPHVGWNNLHQKQSSTLFDGIPAEALFYYVHSYHVSPNKEDLSYGSCPYGFDFTSVIIQNNIVGTQFHPEKSQEWGLKMLKNFIEIF